MTTLRNTGDSPVRTRRIARVGQALGTAALAGGLAVLAACSDTPTASLAAPGHGPLLATTTAGDAARPHRRVAGVAEGRHMRLCCKKRRDPDQPAEGQAGPWLSVGRSAANFSGTVTEPRGCPL
jgi:hypothetical protein